MGLLDRFRTALVLMKDSLLLLRHNPKLSLFPIVSGAAGIAFLAVFLGVAFGTVGLDFRGDAVVPLAVLFGLLYLILTFISVFFTAALVHQTRAVLDGQEPGLEAGMRGAWAVRRPLFIWAVISATVGVILNAIQDSNSAVGRVLSGLFGIAWTLMTFFIVPVIAFEEPTVREMFTRSAGRFKHTWGETPLSLAGVGLLSFVIAVPFALPGYLILTEFGSVIGVVLIAIGAAVAGVVSHTFKGIVKTTLYFYASEGALPEEFNDVDPASLAK